jgi:hypothetical protein
VVVRWDMDSDRSAHNVLRSPEHAGTWHTTAVDEVYPPFTIELRPYLQLRSSLSWK